MSIVCTLLLHDVHKLVGPCRQHQQLQQIRRNQGVSMGPLPYPKIFGSNLAMEAKHFPLNNLLVSVLGTLNAITKFVLDIVKYNFNVKYGT